MLLSKTLLHAQGLFETFIYNGYTRNLKRHIARLTNSAIELFDIYLKESDFLEILPSLKEGFVSKIVLETFGEDTFYEKPIEYKLLAYSKSPKPSLKYVPLCISEYKRHSSDPVIRYKTTNYFLNTLSKQKAIAKGFYDAIFLNENDFIQETSSANIIFVKGSKIYHPHTDDGFLYGTTLSVICECFDISFERLKVSDIQKFDSCFILNSVIGAVAVSNIEYVDFFIDEGLLNELNLCIEKDNLY